MDRATRCEKKWVFLTMMFVGGYYGAFTSCLRGGVVCNGQTGNLMRLAIDLGGGNWLHAINYLIPFIAYLLGTFISEQASLFGSGKPLRWETTLTAAEIAAVLVLGALPESAPVQITQLAVYFICSMQYNTFQSTQGQAASTTFCTNHVRQTGAALARLTARRGEEQSQNAKKLFLHLEMLGAFVAGGIVSTAACGRLLGKAIWLALIPLAVVFVSLLKTDMKQRINEAV